jgi:hypothetical protein
MSAPAPSNAPAKAVGTRSPEGLHRSRRAHLRAAVEPRVRHPRRLRPEEARPKALAAFSFKLADAFEQATMETDRMKASIEAANKAAVKLDEVDLSSVFQSTKK